MPRMARMCSGAEHAGREEAQAAHTCGTQGHVWAVAHMLSRK